nr:uncharacterized protein LOC105495882 [Macaca nemestrina]
MGVGDPQLSLRVLTLMPGTACPHFASSEILRLLPSVNLKLLVRLTTSRLSDSQCAKLIREAENSSLNLTVILAATVETRFIRYPVEEVYSLKFDSLKAVISDWEKLKPQETGKPLWTLGKGDNGEWQEKTESSIEME